MNDILKIGIGFGAGAAIGTAIGCYITKNKADKEKDIEIQSVKETFSRQIPIVQKENEIANEKAVQAKEKAVQAIEKPSIDKFVKASIENDTSTISGNLPEDSGIHIITAGEYSSDEFETYKKITLMYYNNDILFDTNSKTIIDDYTNIIGTSSLEQFEDVLYVRNDAMKTDFDIQKVNKPYVFSQE